MTYITTKIQIDRPGSEVFAYISNPENNPQWQNGMQSCEITSEGEWGAGSTYHQKAKFLGRDIVSNFIISEFEPGKRIKGETVESSFPITFTRIVHPNESGNGCNVEVIVTGDASGIFRLFSPLMDWMVGRSIKQDYGRLKSLLESRNS